jgi:hypothetical protein
VITRKDVTVERRKVKSGRIMVQPDLQVRLIVPRRTSNAEIDEIIRRKSKWIDKKLKYFKHRKSLGVQLKRGEVLLHGEVYRYVPTPDLGRQVAVDSNARTISSGRNLLDAQVLEEWYREEARRVISKRLRHYATEYKLPYNRLYIRGQKTRWGSCSARKNLSFNWRLIQVPPRILDYVVAHELVHAQHFDHSEAFWERLGAVYPEYEEAMEWLENYHAYQRHE